MCDKNGKIPIVGSPISTVNVDGIAYELRVSPLPILDERGRGCQTVIDHVRRVLWLHPDLEQTESMVASATAFVVARAWHESAPGVKSKAPLAGEGLERVPVMDDEYELRVAAGPLMDGNGHRCKGLVDSDRKALWLDPMVPEDERPRIAAAMVARAWQRAHGGRAEGDAWPLIKTALRASARHEAPARHLLDALADEMESAAADAGYSVEHFVALALYRAVNADAEDWGGTEGEHAHWAERTGAEIAREEARFAESTDQPESLPSSEMAGLARDLLQVQWRILAPPGFPLPAGVPDDAKLIDWGKGRPPRIVAGDGRHFCPACGRGFKRNPWLGRHLQKAHSWTRDEASDLMPPNREREARAAA